MFETPIIAAPMAGGPSTIELVSAVGSAGALGFLAGGYKSAEQLGEQIRLVRAAGVDFGVNLFVPGASSASPGIADAADSGTTDAGTTDAGTAGADSPDTDAVRRYRQQLLPEAARYGVELPEIRTSDDGWDAKLDLLLGDPVRYVSFTFGLPPERSISRLRHAGSTVLIMVTTPQEARAAVAAGAQALIVQHRQAGGHSGTFTPAAHTSRPETSHPGTSRPGTSQAGISQAGISGAVGSQQGTADAAALVAQVRAAVGPGVPLIGAGGLGNGADIGHVLAAGAAAAQLGTAFLRSPESGARALHKDALADPRFTETRLTFAFSGRPARALVNRFVRDHDDAPLGYPMIHYLTAPLRAAAAAAGDVDGLNLWAGTAFRQARDLPAAEIVAGLLAEL